MSANARDDDDGVLLVSARAGDRAAFAALVSRHQGALFRAARALTRDAARAEDAVQQVFVVLWRHVSARDAAPIDHVRGWLFGTMRHVLSHATRRRAGEPVHFDDVETLALAAGFAEDDPFERSSLAERRAILARGLARLDDEERAVVELRDIEGLPGDDVAHMLGLTVPAMKSRLHRARLHLMGEVRALTREEVLDAR